MIKRNVLLILTIFMVFGCSSPSEEDTRKAVHSYIDSLEIYSIESIFLLQNMMVAQSERELFSQVKKLAKTNKKMAKECKKLPDKKLKEDCENIFNSMAKIFSKPKRIANIDTQISFSKLEKDVEIFKRKLIQTYPDYIGFENGGIVKK